MDSNTRRFLWAALCGIGAFLIIAGLMGYDLRRTALRPARWVGYIIWDQVAGGAAFLAYGLWELRQWMRSQ